MPRAQPRFMPLDVIHLPCDPPVPSPTLTTKNNIIAQPRFLPSDIIHLICNLEHTEQWNYTTLLSTPQRSFTSYATLTLENGEHLDYATQNNGVFYTLTLISLTPHSLRQQERKPATYTALLPPPYPLHLPIHSFLLPYKTYSNSH